LFFPPEFSKFANGSWHMESSELSQEEKAKFVGEEDNDENTTPEMELAAAVAIGLFSLIGLYFAYGLDVPDTLFTAPGLFPVFTSISLFAMAIGLAVKALRAGARTGLNVQFQQLPVQGQGLTFNFNSYPAFFKMKKMRALANWLQLS